MVTMCKVVSQNKVDIAQEVRQCISTSETNYWMHHDDKKDSN